MKKILMLTTAAALVFVPVAPAFAAGIFGKGGLIRGWVGEKLDKHVEGPILTPLARGAAVSLGRAVAIAVAGPSAGPVGAAFGEAVNQAARGGGSTEPKKVIETGKICATTTVGNWSLSEAQPVGNACMVKLQNGTEIPGTVKS